jgi:molybdate transport system substrate-binding protein
MQSANFLIQFLLISYVCSVSLRLSAAQVTVFAAASLTDALREIAVNYQQQSGDKIVFNFGASSTLARQIEEGAPADVFFSADDAQMKRLEGKGLMVERTLRNLLSNALVIVVAAENGANVRSPKDLARPEIRRVALGDPKAVPIGVYARKYLEKAGLWKAVASKVVPTENVRGALAAVESGNAEASIVYKTDALISKKVVIAYSVPLSEGPEVRYPVALIKEAREPNASERFLAYVASEPAAKVFEKRGFVVNRNPGK